MELWVDKLNPERNTGLRGDRGWSKVLVSINSRLLVPTYFNKDFGLMGEEGALNRHL